MSDTLRIISDAGKAMSRYGMRINQSIDSIATKLESFFEHARQIQAERELNVRTGWWYVDFIIDNLPTETTDDALRREESYGAFTSLIIRECNKHDKEHLTDMRLRWEKSKLLDDDRKAIVTDALDAHMSGKYTLSVPAILPQIEFLYDSHFSKSKRVPFQYSEINKSEFNRTQYEEYSGFFMEGSLSKLPLDRYFELYPVYLFLTNILFANERRRKYQEENDTDLHTLSLVGNRNLILHGEDAEYATEAISLKRILLADKLLYTLDSSST